MAIVFWKQAGLSVIIGSIQLGLLKLLKHVLSLTKVDGLWEWRKYARVSSDS